ncbi:MAG: hypothetical protein ACE5FT_07995 [Candidatus Nanoarchaeia archaeon]
MRRVSCFILLISVSIEKKILSLKCLIITTIAVLASLLTVTYIAGPALALVDFNAYKGSSISDILIDGTIGTEWDDAKQYDNVPITPSGTAKIWVKNDGTYLYIAIRFTADSNNPWIALQFDATGCMDAGADVAIFGDDNLVSDEYSDAHFSGISVVVADATQDGVGAIDIGIGNTVTIELKKLLNSGDSAGNDIAWSEGNTYSLVIAWDSNGGGSSGGNINHKAGVPTARTIYINPEVIPPPVLTATIDISPDSLNMWSKGKWITAYIELPEGYNPEGIDATTILLNETIQPVLDPKYDFVTNSSEYLVDHNEDGILELMVKFDRQDIIAIVSIGNVSLIITGKVNGTPFEGTDTIRVIDE